MNDSIFPRRRADGSFSVAIRYRLSRADAVRASRELVDSWIETKRNRDHLDVAAELADSPSVDLIDSQTMQVVLNCRPSSILWKGLMVELTQQLNAVEGVERLGFWDLVTGLVHPASVEP